MPALPRDPAATEDAASASVVRVRPLPAGTLARLVAIVRPVRLDAVMEALVALAPRDVLIEPVRGYGRQKEHLDFYEEGFGDAGFLPKVRLQFSVESERLDEAVTALRTGARTGRIGDGKIFVQAVSPAPARPAPPERGVA